MTTPAPYFETVAYGPKGGRAEWHVTTDGVRVRIALWPSDGAKGTVLLFPGRTEYVEKYGDAAREYSERGYAVASIDWRGQGLADRLTDERMLGHVGAFTDYQLDVAALLSAVSAAGLPGPQFLVGHSMGGCIGLRSLIEGLDVKAAAFSAPMWGIKMASGLRQLALGLGQMTLALGLDKRFAPSTGPDTYVLKEPFENNTLTRDPKMFAMLQEQSRHCPDLTLGGPSYSWLMRAIRECDWLLAQPAPDVSTVTVVGSEEQIVDPAAIETRMSNWLKGTLHIAPNAEHEIMMEVPETRQDFFDRSTALFDQYV